MYMDRCRDISHYLIFFSSRHIFWATVLTVLQWFLFVALLTP